MPSGHAAGRHTGGMARRGQATTVAGSCDDFHMSSPFCWKSYREGWEVATSQTQTAPVTNPQASVKSIGAHLNHADKRSPVETGMMTADSVRYDMGGWALFDNRGTAFLHG